MILTIVGPGNMGEQIIKILDQTSDLTIKIVHPNSDRQSYLSSTYNTQNIDIPELINSDIILLTFKPGKADEICDKLVGHISKNALIVSLLAGIPVKFFQNKFKHENVCRIMTTYIIPEKNPKNVYFYYPQPLSDKKQLCSKFGNINFIETTSDDHLDRIMAIHACGPAFISKLIRNYISAANDVIQISDNEIIDLLEETTYYLKSSSPEDLIDKVACKNGATEAALKKVDNVQIEMLIHLMFNHAYGRAHEFSLKFQ